MYVAFHTSAQHNRSGRVHLDDDAETASQARRKESTWRAARTPPVVLRNTAWICTGEAEYDACLWRDNRVEYCTYLGGGSDVPHKGGSTDGRAVFEVCVDHPSADVEGCRRWSHRLRKQCAGLGDLGRAANTRDMNDSAREHLGVTSTISGPKLYDERHMAPDRLGQHWHRFHRLDVLTIGRPQC